MGQASSVPVPHKSRGRWLRNLTTLQAAAKAHFQGLKLSKYANCNNLRPSLKEKQHQDSQSKSRPSLFYAGPLTLKRASRRAWALLRCLQDHDAPSTKDTSLSPSHYSQVASRRRDIYLHQLGIRHHSDKRRSRRQRPRATRRFTESSASEYLDLILEETGQEMPMTRQSTITGMSMGTMSRQTTGTSMSRQSSMEAYFSRQCSFDRQTTEEYWSQQTSPDTFLGPQSSSDRSDSCDRLDSGEDMTVRSDILNGQAAPKDHARMKFLQKLSYNGVWLPRPQRAPSHQTVIIFDWDDTLLCTSFLARMDFCREMPEPVQLALKRIEAAAIALLALAVSFGQTFIITNAVSGWVEYSADKYLPGLAHWIERVQVVSARSQYEAEFPNQVAKWKNEAFLDIQRQLDSQVITNLVSLGDSDFEMDATLAMGRLFEKATIKTIKFQVGPSALELAAQQELVCREFKKILGNARSTRVVTHAPRKRSQPSCSSNEK